MSQTIILVNSCKDFKVRNAEQRLMNFAEYVAGDDAQSNSRTRIINLCRRYGYRSEGYYCSLLAEARGQKVIPSLQTLSNLSQQNRLTILRLLRL